MFDLLINLLIGVLVVWTVLFLISPAGRLIAYGLGVLAMMAVGVCCSFGGALFLVFLFKVGK